MQTPDPADTDRPDWACVLCPPPREDGQWRQADPGVYDVQYWADTCTSPRGGFAHVRTTCRFDGCSCREHSRGYCNRHYMALLGTPAIPRRPTPTLRSKMAEHTGPIDPSTGCMPWTGTRVAGGYGTFTLSRKVRPYAHRVAWELANGRPVPDGLVVDHECHNRDKACPGGNECQHRLCVNPDHLAVVTNGENAARSRLALTTINRGKTHCPRGHPYDTANTYVRKRRNGRVCRTCARQLRAEKQQARRSAA